MEARWSRAPRGTVHAWAALVVALAALAAPFGTQAFLQEQESAYLAAFDDLVADSYSALTDAPAALLSACVGDGTSVPGVGASEQVLTASSADGRWVSAQSAATQCGPGSPGATAVCVVPAGLTLVMGGSLNVAALAVRGALEWSDDTQPVVEQWLCAGYVAVEHGGALRLNIPDRGKRAWVYIKNNGAVHPVLRTRAFGSVSSSLDVTGARLRRTWSVLAAPLTAGASELALLHDPVAMRWQVGDRIVVAPTKARSSGDAQAFRITGFASGNRVLLDAAAVDDHGAEFVSGGTPAGASDHPPYAALLAAEVINLSRNVVITGDDLAHVDCDPALTTSDAGRAGHSSSGCMCNAGHQRTKCTMGLHTAAMFGDTRARMAYTRVEKCGQRGVLGKYCLHFHHKGACTECVFEGNAVEYGHQRGMIVHATHLSTSRYNVFNDVRGAAVYVEDGNEMWNNIDYNVAVCPWRFGDASPKRGCTVPGTPNGQADTSLNQAGFYSQTIVNNMVGNRAANSFNGMFLDAGSQGRGAAQGQVCTNKVQVGVMAGNTFHSHGRFGTYLLGDNFPKHTDQSVASNGYMTDTSLCTHILPDGSDNGLPGAIVDHVDFGNAFVGQYNAGDIQYLGHTGVRNLNNIYWKETKSFADGCAAHLASGTYADGNMALPDHGAFIIKDTRFEGSLHLEANHHCNVGVTGVLCQPMYVLANVAWAAQPNAEWAGFLDFSTQAHPSDANFGGMFVLAPPDAAAHLAKSDAQVLASDSFFPPGYISLTSHHYSYLLALGSAGAAVPCALAEDLGAVVPGVSGSAMKQRYDSGILCSEPLRALRVYTRDLTSDTAVALKVEVWANSGGVGGQTGAPTTQQLIPFHQVGGQATEVMPKQGYSLPVIPGPAYSYRISLGGGGDLPADWVIEFSDPVFGNRWAPEALHLVVAGRDCGAAVSSQHDRLFMYDHSSQKFGRGACTAHPDMPPIDCDGPGAGAGGATAPVPVAALNITSCPGLCPDDCGPNLMCNCGTSECTCRPGFGGDDCSVSLCDAARCSGHGVCTATYLGGDLPVSRAACVCDVPWAGPLCDRNPCLDAGRTCSGHGVCVAVGDTATRCECDSGYSGAECDTTCIGVCQGGGGEHPFGCAGHIEGAAELLCGPTGGCSYPATSGGGPGGWCVYRTYGSSSGGCADAGCYASDDCHLAGECQADGTCAAETALPDGTACNSVPFGTCQAAVCTEPGQPCGEVVPNLFWFDDGTNPPALYTDDCGSVLGGCPDGARTVNGFTFVKLVERPGDMLQPTNECQSPSP